MRTQISPRRQARSAHGFTLIELIVVVAVIAILGAIAVPALFRAQISANETSAVGSLRAVQSAEMSYHATAGGGGYAVQLSTLAQRCPGSGQSFVSADLAQDPSVKAGYRITLQAASGAQASRNDCNGTATYSAFYSTAVPVEYPRSGRRGYATNGSASIYFDPSGAAPTEAVMTANGGGQVIQ